MKQIAFFMLILVEFSFVPKKENLIYWSKNYQLTWNDFIKKRETHSKIGAVSAIAIGPIYSTYTKNTFETDISSVFDKSQSWVEKGHQTNEALKHEQGHFDIGEIYARKLRKEITECKFTSKNLKEKSKKQIQKIISEHDKCQKLYDKETCRHTNIEKQLVWNSRIEKGLEELKAHSETHLVINIKE